MAGPFAGAADEARSVKEMEQYDAYKLSEMGFHTVVGRFVFRGGRRRRL
jgi:hypothetical protein